MRVLLPETACRTARALIVVLVFALIGCGKPAAPVGQSPPAQEKKTAAPVQRLTGSDNSVAAPIQDLSAPNKRDAALARLLGHKEPSSVKVNHVVVCAQPQGPPIYAVFKAERYDLRQGGGPGKAIGHVILFDSNGKQIPFCMNANSIQGVFEDVNGDGIVENVEPHTISPAAPRGVKLERPGVNTLIVLPIVRNPTPLLYVAYGIERHTKDDSGWSWEVSPPGKDGMREIRFGPKQGGKVTPQAVYTWAPEQHRYLGPEGAYDRTFKRIDPSTWAEGLDAFEKAHPE